MPRSYKNLLDNYGINSGEKILWLLDKNKNLIPARITTGIYDSTNIEITGGDVDAEDRIIIGYSNNTDNGNNSVGPIKIPGVKRF